MRIPWAVTPQSYLEVEPFPTKRDGYNPNRRGSATRDKRKIWTNSLGIYNFEQLDILKQLRERETLELALASTFLKKITCNTPL